MIGIAPLTLLKLWFLRIDYYTFSFVTFHLCTIFQSKVSFLHLHLERKPNPETISSFESYASNSLCFEIIISNIKLLIIIKSSYWFGGLHLDYEIKTQNYQKNAQNFHIKCTKMSKKSHAHVFDLVKNRNLNMINV